ncbi:MAG: ATP-binding protein, partial [Micrococcales bacterium]|nr:ATP-binding protein [Micrococcales bacterium]
MRILLIGAGGVGDAVAKIAAKRNFFEHMVVSDYDQTRAEKTIAWIESKYGAEVAARFSAVKIDASNAASMAALISEQNIDWVVNAVEPKFVPT